MTKSRMTRILAATLAAMMMLSMLAACAGDGDTTTDTTAAPAASHETTAAPAETEPPTHDENGFLLDSLPADLDFEGEKVGVLYWGDCEMQEFEADEITGEIVNDAVFKRNETVQDRLNVVLEWYTANGNNNNSAVFLQKAQAATMPARRSLTSMPPTPAPQASWLRTISAITSPSAIISTSRSPGGLSVCSIRPSSATDFTSSRVISPPIPCT